MNEIHISPSGDDTAPGTPERPVATLHHARDLARKLDGPATVILHEGTHTLGSSLELTEADAETTYQGRGEVVVSGGRRITGWRELDGVWRAEVGDLDTRHLTVGGHRATRASIDAIPGNVTKTETGYVTDSIEPQQWTGQADIEFVYTGVYPWTEARCPVAAVSGDDRSTTITMAQPAFGWATDLYNSVVPWEEVEFHGLGLPTRVENAAAFLTEPGTFTLDRTEPGRHVLLYRPRPGEHPEHTTAVASVLETLVKATGTRDLTFRGITFADATWLHPSGPEGFLHYHGTDFYAGGTIEKVVFGEDAWVTVPKDTKTVPAGLVFADTTHATVVDCRFTALGATALEFAAGTGALVRGNVFENVSGSGVAIGGSRGTRVENNWIHHVGLDYPGCPGIAVTDGHDTTIAHNQVNDIPHCGIVVGPGEGAKLLRNLTVRTLSKLADGGGIRVSGPQGTSHADGALVQGNVITDTITPYNFGLYTDYGAAWVTVEGNVVRRGDNTAILLTSPPLEHVVFRGNVWDADPVGAAEPPEGVTLEDNTTLTDPDALDARTADMTARAGLEPGYTHLLNR
ncbi:right-handed parallel beta-helix repeat-containing protein [Nonomuraea longicatena]|uniref:Right-handed parallel beta-helix repeat-containing protein n=1 Tax=Nonomuraea longicatena TaxID=83682 RepID=A0ABP4AEV5_9ACTN